MHTHTLLSFANGYILDLSIRFVPILGSQWNRQSGSKCLPFFFLLLQFFGTFAFSFSFAPLLLYLKVVSNNSFSKNTCFRSFYFYGWFLWRLHFFRWARSREGEVQGDLRRTWPDLRRNVRLLKTKTLSHKLSSLFLCVFSVQPASTKMLFLLGSTQIASYWSNSGIIGHLYIFKLYRISANHTNVQLSPKKQYVKFLHFLRFAIEINMVLSWTLLVFPSPQLQSVVCTCLCLFIHNNLYRSYVCHRIWLLKFLENRVKWQYSLLCTDYELFEIFKSNKLYKISPFFFNNKIYWKNFTCRWW